MQTEIPFRLVREHGPTIEAMLLGGVRSVLPFVRKHRSGLRIERTLNSPSAELVDAFRSFTGDRGRGHDSLPPALVVAQAGLSVVAELTSRCPYPLLGVLNQGIDLEVNDVLPVGEPLVVGGELVDASDDGYRARIHTRVRIGNAGRAPALSVDAYAAVVLRKRPESAKREPDTTLYRSIDRWSAELEDGRRFFYLSGDFNPIHTLPFVARRTRFRGCIMHGYGALSRIYAAIEREFGPIRRIEARFVSPLPLPSPMLSVETSVDADDEGYRRYRLMDSDGRVYQAGRFTTGKR